MPYLIGGRFRVGEVGCLGEEHCEPLHHLAELLQAQVVLRRGTSFELVGQPAQVKT